MRKRLHRFVLAVSVCALLSGCVSGPASPEQTTPPTTTAPTIVPTTQAPTEPPTEPTTVPTTEAPTEPPTEAPTEPPLQLMLTQQEITMTRKGEVVELYCGEVELTDISWFCDDESIALFSQGKVVCVNAGTTTVYARYMNQEVSCQVTCDVEEGPAGYISDDLLHAPRLAPPVVDMEDTSFFDDAAFIGDSVSYALQQWHNMNGSFGNATFLTRSSMGLQNTIDGRITIFFQGRNLSPEDAVAAAQVNKVFVMLGFNDIALWGVEGTLERWDIFLGRILEKSPDVDIYIQSCTPVHYYGAYPGYDNDLFDRYNEALEAYCQENGYHFVNIAPYFKDFTNSMATVYSNDRFVHMTFDGTAVWERVLKAYAAEQTKGE